MAGGIQKGTEAGSEESKKLDGDVREVADAIDQVQGKFCYERGHRNYVSDKFTEEVRDRNSLPELVKLGVQSGCVPDGGMWFDGFRNEPRTLKVVFEAKHQGKGGNAIERWATNFLLCQRINPSLKYITFMTGEGSKEGEVLQTYATDMKKVLGDCVEFYFSAEGFTQEQIFEVMRDALGLDLTFDQIKPYLGVKMRSTFDDFIVELTPEQVLAELASKQVDIKADEHFVSSLTNPLDPLTIVWKSVDSEDKMDAKDIAIDLIKEGVGNAEIATTLIETFNIGNRL